MKFIFACALALAYTLPCVLGIYRGQNASEEQFLYQVRIERHPKRGKFPDCGASLIATEWLLTAAHCVRGNNDTNVYLADGSVLRSINVTIHEAFDAYMLRNDIALIKIPAVTLTKQIGIVQLPAMGAVNSEYENQNATVSGWGLKGRRAIPDILQWTTLKVILNTDCASRHMDPIWSGFICATGYNKSGVCQGDSGGALVLTNTQTQIGIVATGSRHGCHRGYPGIFTRITPYLQWIKDNSGVFYQ